MCLDFGEMDERDRGVGGCFGVMKCTSMYLCKCVGAEKGGGSSVCGASMRHQEESRASGKDGG